MALLGMVLVGSFGRTMAQTPSKIGYFDTRYVFSKLPEYKNAQNALQVYTKQLQSEAANKQKELQTKYVDFQKLVSAKPPTPAAILEARKAEINKLQQALQQFQQAAQQQVVKKENALLSPISRKVQKAIDKVAKANNYALVIKKEALLFELPGENISDLVLKDLGITVAKKENK